MNELMSLKGTNGTVTAYDDRVVISRKGLAAFAAQGIKGDKTIFYSDLASVEFKKPGWTNGYIKFIYAGTVSITARVGMLKTSMKSLEDENTVILRAFNKSIPQQSEDLYNLLLKNIQEYKQVSSHPTAQGSVADELMKLAKLKEQGVLTQEEFDKKKAELL